MNKIFTLVVVVGILISCLNSDDLKKQSYTTNEIDKVIQTAEQQIGYQVKLIEESGEILIPRTIGNGKVLYSSKRGWTSGFFPGTMFYMYDLTKDPIWLDYGIKYTENLDSVKYLKSHHDVGFMINSSFGNALRVTG